MNSNVTFRIILKIENILLRIAIANIKRKKYIYKKFTILLYEIQIQNKREETVSLPNPKLWRVIAKAIGISESILIEDLQK